MPDQYDVIVIGAGAVGENVAGRTSSGGLRTVIIEKELVGGECTYWACMPSKALLRPGEALTAVRRTPGARAAVTRGIDVREALERRNALAGHWDDAQQVKWLESVHVELMRGSARLSGERRVVVEGKNGPHRQLEASKAVVLATGSVATIPPIDGLREAQPWDSRKATSASEVPDSLIVLGGGAVGVELAQAWRMLGTQCVTLLEMKDRLLSNEEPFASEAVARSLADMNIRVLTGVQLRSVERRGALVTATLEDGETVQGAEILVAAGRKPVTEAIGLETVGLDPAKPLEVDDHLRVEGVSGSWLYAVGDVNGRNPFTHMGKYQARIAADVILGNDRTAFADHVANTRVVFTDPQIAAVGLTEAQARQEGLRVRTVRYPYGGVAGAATLGEGIEGTCQLVVDENRRVIVGATFVGPGAGEQLHAATIAIVGGITLDRLWHAVPAFPTISEVWLRLLEAYGL